MGHPKSMGLLEIKGKKFRLKTFPYTQHRPLVYADVVLADVVIAPADQGTATVHYRPSSTSTTS